MGLKLTNWVKNRPLIISGPCSAETEEQVFLTAQQLAKTNKVNYLRAGIWKPRTRPNSFEGVGEKGLQWLKDAGKSVGLPVTTEVAKAKHVELALKNEIDLLWIGARTSANPFSVQEIAEALKGVDIPVLVKNPVNPDLQLWIGALERINQAGITKLGAIHRGFSSYNKSVYRNEPKWEIPIDLKRTFPDLPIICDPSHISGNRDLIYKVTQKSMDLEMDGLMIESHCNPDKAWSDAKQQITPENLAELLNRIVYRTYNTTNPVFIDKLSELRDLIDKLDENIINMLGERMKIAQQIGKYKKENDVTILQVDRWDSILNSRKQIADELGLSEAFITEYLRILHEESISQQAKIMNK